MKATKNSHQDGRAFSRQWKEAFSLIEVLVAVTLMSVIVLGLLAMFTEVQRAFRTGITQVDVMESGRSAMEMISREIEQATPTRLQNSASFFAFNRRWTGSEMAPLVQTLPGAGPTAAVQRRVNLVQDVFFTTRENQNWQGVGYSVTYDGSSVGTLFRYENNASAIDSIGVANLGTTTFQARPNRIADGVVHFRVLAYDTRGRLLTPDSYFTNSFATNSAVVPASRSEVVLNYNNLSPLSYEYDFRSNSVPAYVDVEIGVLEQKTVEKARGLVYSSGLSPSDAAQAQVRYLGNQAGRVQIFRQRVPIRNVDPSVYYQ